MHKISAWGAVLVFVLGTMAHAQTPQQDAQRAAEAWLALIDAGNTAESWAQAGTPFRAAVTQEQWVAAAEQARTGLGAVRGRTLESAELVRDLPGAPPGEYVRLRFGSTTESGARVTENVVMFREGDAWRSVGYFIAPAAAPANYAAPQGAPYTAEDVRIGTAAGHMLAGTLTRPTNARVPVPAVVLISGSGPQDRDSALPGIEGYRPFRQIADSLGRRGIAVLRMDDRGVGGSGQGTPGATSADLADDVRAAVAWLRARPDIDARRIALLGHSEGGIIAPMVAAADPQIAAVVLMAAQSRTGRAVNLHQNREALEAQAGLSPAQRDSIMATVPARVDSVAASNPWFRYFLNHDPLPTARRVRVPVLILHGATDRQVTPDQAPELEAALREAGNADVAVHIFSGLNHLFLPDMDGAPSGYAGLPSKEVPPGVLGTLADWLATRLSR